MFNDEQHSKIINTTRKAVNHYMNGKGETVELGENTKNELKNHPEQQRRAYRIKNELTTRMSGNYGVNMTGYTYHVGDTRVDYSTTCKTDTCTTTYTGFSSDGFWDPWAIGGGDGIGGSWEFYGTGYHYNPYSWTETYENPYNN